MKKVVLINGSPRYEKKTASAGFIAHVDSILKYEKYEKHIVNIRESLKNSPDEDYAVMAEADAFIIVFPLYYYCLPGLLMRFLEDYSKYVKDYVEQKKSIKVYAVVNCGFPEPDINKEAIRVVRCFSKNVGAQFRFGVMIGGGPMISSVEGSGPVKKAYEKLDESIRTMAYDIYCENLQVIPDIMIKPSFPRGLYLLIGSIGWKKQARKNGLKTKDLYRKPYEKAR